MTRITQMARRPLPIRLLPRITAASAALLLLLVLTGAAPFAQAAPAKAGKASSSKRPTAEQALAILKAGNHRYATHHLKHPDQSERRMHDVEREQHPFAVILGCSDSRVPPEILFDQGLGDLFVVRVAGNVPDDDVIGSIEYAVVHLQTPLVVVLGHEQCGAVTAATHAAENNHTRSFTEWLRPLVDAVRGQPGDLVHNAMCLSVMRIVQILRQSDPVLKSATDHGHVRIVGAYYELHTGKIIWNRELP